MQRKEQCNAGCAGSLEGAGGGAKTAVVPLSIRSFEYCTRPDYTELLVCMQSTFWINSELDIGPPLLPIDILPPQR